MYTGIDYIHISNGFLDHCQDEDGPPPSKDLTLPYLTLPYLTLPYLTKVVGAQ